MWPLVSLAAAVAALVAEPAPVPIGVPEELLARTTMPEPSGIVWSPALARYLVVSDDTGDKQQGTNHAPWLFSMTRDGVFDAAPVPILNLEQLNDAEGLCAGPRNTFLLATSHSANKKGRDKPARRRLFQLELAGRALKILGSLDLASAIDAAGVVPPGGVDIEAIAFKSGELYVGLKAPQSADGSAFILRVRDIIPALKAGALPAAQVQVFAQVPLRVTVGGIPVVQGISDMGFLPDGSIALLANSPKKMPPDGGGALWWLRPGSAPVLLRKFTGLKPEGVTLTPDGKAMMIVFDYDRHQPVWLHQPLPQKPAEPRSR